MSDDVKSHDDRAHGAMPPELRPFVKPEPTQPLVMPGKEAEFKAAVGALRLLNGGPAADPFYVDPKEDAAAAAGERKTPASTTAYVSPAVVPVVEAKVREGVSGTKV